LIRRNKLIKINARGNIQTSLKGSVSCDGLKHRKLLYDEELQKLLDPAKKIKIQLSHVKSQMNG
jgi:RNase adaptor protein for sRNA GlmZ degradation